MEAWLNTLFPWDEPTSRLYHVNLLMALIFLFAWSIYWTKQKKSKFNLHDFKRILRLLIFSKKYWFNSSTRVDYFLYFFNGLWKAFLFFPLLSLTYNIALVTLNFLQFFKTSDRFLLEINSISIFIFSLLSFIWDDWLRFFHHWCMHKVPLLWTFHKVHHSAQVLTPITLFRTHPLESFMGVLRNSLSLGVSSGVFIFLFQSPLTLWTILGVNGFGFIFNFFGATLRHSQIPISFGFLEVLFISPKQHQIHHSVNKNLFDKNYGVNLALWDKLLDTLIYSHQVKKIELPKLKS